MSSDTHATRQSEPCPSWCTQQHSDDDHPDDRFHDSAVTQVSVIFAERDHVAGPGRWVHTAGEISIVTSRHIDTSDVVVFIGRDDQVNQQINLTTDSAARLAEAITRHLDATR